jgi:hypothetical protein
MNFPPEALLRANATSARDELERLIRVAMQTEGFWPENIEGRVHKRYALAAHIADQIELLSGKVFV